MIAAGLGLEAINNGYTVCFEKMVNLVKILDTAEMERNAGFRIKNIKKAQMVIIDEIGYTPISRAQANKFFTFISDTYETTSIVFTTNKEITDWAEMMGGSGAYHCIAGQDTASCDMILPQRRIISHETP